MSTTYELHARAKVARLPYVIAILIALSIGATAGSLVTRAITDRAHPVATATGWDVQKLEAMQGRQLAASIQFGVQPWDAAKLTAMAGRERAEAITLRGASGPAH